MNSESSEQVVVFHGQDQVLDICVDRLTTSLRRTVFKGPKPLQQGSLPGEQRFWLDQREPVLGVSCPDVVFLLEQRVFREDLLFDRKAWKKIRIKVPKKVIMSTLKAGCFPEQNIGTSKVRWNKSPYAAGAKNASTRKILSDAQITLLTSITGIVQQSRTAYEESAHWVALRKQIEQK